MFKYYNHLGFFNPYFFDSNIEEMKYFSNIQDAISNFSEEINIDSTAIAEILNGNYILGNRTLIKKIKRSPWLAKPNDENDGWDFFKLKKHEELVVEEKVIADNLFKFLCEEIISYTYGKKRIGVLLSGGMDSRILAGTLDYLLKTRQIHTEIVTGYTWGNTNSRDVAYAKKIAERLGWHWKHYTVTADNLWENFKIAGIRGCEYSGIHLHAIPQIQKDLDVDVLLAGSFGDSIGRAEYSGNHVENLKPINYGWKNFAWLLNNKTYKQVNKSIKDDIYFYHKKFHEEKKYQQYELDYQLHYMRRMLNPCMELLNEKAPTFQVFTSPDIYQYMWRIHPSKRNNKIYLLLMEKFITKLDDIPWARTGLLYGQTEGKPDSLSKNHHSYQTQIQKELLPKIKNTLFLNMNIIPGFFNKNSIKVLLKSIENKPGENFDFLERISWLVSLVYFLDYYKIKKESINNRSFIDNINSYFKLPIFYKLKHVYRRVK